MNHDWNPQARGVQKLETFGIGTNTDGSWYLGSKLGSQRSSKRGQILDEPGQVMREAVLQQRIRRFRQRCAKTSSSFTAAYIRIDD